MDYNAEELEKARVAWEKNQRYAAMFKDKGGLTFPVHQSQTDKYHNNHGKKHERKMVRKSLRKYVKKVNR